MNTPYLKIGTLLALISGAANTASAADEESPWSLSILGEGAFSMSGSLKEPGSFALPNLGSLDPALAGTPGTVSFDKLRYDDIFGTRYGAGVELDYALNDNVQTYGRIGYEALAGHSRRFAQLTGESLPTELVRANFDDADNVSYQIGSRYRWSTDDAWQPFVGLALGATHLDAMRAGLTSTNPDFGLKTVDFTHSDTVFSQSAEAGIDINPSRAFDLRLSVDADHYGVPHSANDPTLAALGVQAGHDAESRWAFPVEISASYNF